MHFAFETFRFDVMAQKLYDFTWHEYCDWYLELTKLVLREGTPRLRPPPGECSSRYSKPYRLMHPIIPFLTETLWHSGTAARPPCPRLTAPTLSGTETP